MPGHGERCQMISCNFTELEHLGHFYDTPSIILQAVALTLIILSAFMANGLMCLVFYKRPHLLNVAHIFVLNLAICNLAIAVLALPFTLGAVVSQSWPFGTIWCLSQAFLFNTLVMGSTSTVLMVSLDRYYAIMSSLKYPYVFTIFRCKVLIGVQWIIVILAAAPPLAGWGKYTFQRYKYVCSLEWKPGRMADGYNIVVGIFFYAIPTGIICWCYGRIFIAAVSHTKRRNKVYPSTEDSTHTATGESSGSFKRNTMLFEARKKVRDFKAVRTILLIILTFMLCRGPYFIISGIEAQGILVNPKWQTCAMFLLYSETVINQCIYGYLNRVTRFEIWRMVKLIVNQGNQSTTMTESDEFASTTTSSYRMKTFGKRKMVPSINVIPVQLNTIAEVTEDVGESNTGSVYI
ncbi:unnamed protein product [Owenia fusiformis]|uniref:Uncharacterized protein n=1 Tax=Owenia fusiformis TaxID=6347 RepID=A0A8J1U940_OWEFU|nr:unnamed protein product [Owenia fusiformis]